ncbi:hypothetical protein D3C76_1152710 [compost metagenome]
MLGAHREVLAAAGGALAHLHLLGAGFHRQRDADDGDPVAAFFLYHHDRLALVAGLWRFVAIAQLDHRDAAGYRLVQGAADEALGVGGEGEEGGEQQAEGSEHGAFRGATGEWRSLYGWRRVTTVGASLLANMPCTVVVGKSVREQARSYGFTLWLCSCWRHSCSSGRTCAGP